MTFLSVANSLATDSIAKVPPPGTIAQVSVLYTEVNILEMKEKIS